MAKSNWPSLPHMHVMTVREAESEASSVNDGVPRRLRTPHDHVDAHK